MQFDVPDHWVVLRVRSERGRLVADYRDSHGRRLRHPYDEERSTPLFREPDVFVHPAAPFHMVDLIETLPLQRIGPHAGHAVPLPVFVDLPSGFEPTVRNDWLTLPADWPAAHRIQAVTLAHRRWSHRARLRPPIRLLGVGWDATASLEFIRDRPWLVDAIVDRNGLEIRTVSAGDPLGEQTLDRDIVIADPRLVPAAFRGRGGRGIDESRPRLVITFRDGLKGYKVELPPGTSLLVVDPAVAQPFVSTLIYGIVHDYPLHEAVRSASLEVGDPHGLSAHLYSDPLANQDLRLSEAVSGLLREARDLEAGFGEQTLLAVDRLFKEPTVRRILARRSLPLEHPQIRWNLQEVLELRGDFSQEITGLQPMSYAAEALGRARADVAGIGEILGEIVASPSGRDLLSEKQERVVDITVERLEHTPLAPNQWNVTAAQALWLDGRTVMRSGARYRMLVAIGNRSPNSLVTGVVPPILPLLPDGPGHTLEIAVFGLDFGVVGRRVRNVTLPELGPSDIAPFTIRAPRLRPAERRRAVRLRVGVYHENHLVQSFVLSGIVEREERRARQGSLEITLEASRSARFTNLDMLPPRKVSIGINVGPKGTHRLMVKRGRAAADFTYAAEAAAPAVETFRASLFAATYRGPHPRYPADGSVDAEASTMFESTVRDFANLGSDLWNGLVGRAPRSIPPVLREIASSDTTTIQIVRHEVTSVVPWSIIYDYALPDVAFGETPPPVCRGAGAGVASPDPPAKLCDHGPEMAGYCIYGFWGIRYVIEELLPDAVVGDPALAVEPAPGRDSVLLSADVETDPAVIRLDEALKKLLAPSLLGTLKGADRLVEVLWDSGRRPSVLVLVGHHATTDVKGEPRGSRIALPGGKYLRPNDLTSRHARSGRWQRPNTVALVLACGSATTTPSTLNDFVLALNAAGAAAIVGTEVDIFMSMAERFATEVAQDMWSVTRPSLGEAIRTFRLRLAASSNPLAFAFTNYGSADVRVA